MHKFYTKALKLHHTVKKFLKNVLDASPSAPTVTSGSTRMEYRLAGKKKIFFIIILGTKIWTLTIC